jgi:hypothetical protein
MSAVTKRAKRKTALKDKYVISSPTNYPITREQLDLGIKRAGYKSKPLIRAIKATVLDGQSLYSAEKENGLKKSTLKAKAIIAIREWLKAYDEAHLTKELLETGE